jgi:hypothetical protein
MNATEDLAPVITVDWAAVESDIGREIGPDLRRVIEHEGSTSSVALDKWGYADASSTPLFTAVREHGRVIHPDLGPLDSRYAPLESMSGVINVLRILRGEDRNSGTLIEDGEDREYAAGLADLYDAAVALDEQRDDWREGQHPAVRFGSFGPDQLGNLYIHVGHDDQSVIEGVNAEGLPVEFEQLSVHGQRSYTSTEEHFTAILRHERYYSEEETEPTVADERAADIGFLGSNAGKRTLEQGFRERGHEFEEVGTVELGPADPDATLYEYEKGEETRYGVEWTERPVIDDYVVRSLIFDERPDTDAVATAVTIEDHRREQGGGR